MLQQQWIQRDQSSRTYSGKKYKIYETEASKKPKANEESNVKFNRILTPILSSVRIFHEKG